MLRQIYYQFLAYRSIVYPFVVLSAIVVPCWLIFRAYRIRSRQRRTSLRREALLFIAVVYLAGLAASTLEPNANPRLRAADTTGLQLRPDLATLTCSSQLLPPGSRLDPFCAYNAKGNVLLFFPLGILIPLLWRGIRFWRGISIAIAVSVAVEVLQYFSRAWGSYRAADINDVILNVAGAAIGLSLMSLLGLLRRPRPAAARA